MIGHPRSLSALAGAVLIVCTSAGIAGADGTGDPFKEGVALYKAGDFAGAAAKLKQAYDQVPTPETLFALAQAERNAGDCTTAARHYHQVLEQVSDLNVAKLVEQNLIICEKDAPKPKPADPVGTPDPKVVTKVEYRDVHRVDKLGLALFGGGALFAGTAVGLYVAAGANRDAAAGAHSIAEHDQFADRADLERTATVVTAIAGAGLIGYAVFRWVHGSEAGPAVAVAPSSSGGSVFVTGRW